MVLKYTLSVRFPQRSAHCPCAGQFCVCIKQCRRDVNVSNACVKLVHPQLTILWKLREHGCARDGAEHGQSMLGLQSLSTWILPAKIWPNYVASLNVLLQVKSFTWGTIFVLNGISLSVQNMEMQNESKHWETMAKDNKGQIWQEGRKGLKGPKLRGGRESLWRSTSPLKSPFAHSPSRATNAFEWHAIHRELYDLSRLSPSPHPFRHQWQLRYATRLEEILKTIPC